MMRVINTVPGMITFRHNALPIEWNIAVKVIDRQPELSYYFSYKEIRAYQTYFPHRCDLTDWG